jgi:uncharacterized metal-binding protein YceD (DUF177 family)
MSAPELSRPVRVDTLGETWRAMEVEAGEEERAGLAKRFGLIAIGRLAAAVEIRRSNGEVALRGRLSARVTQACVATSEPVNAAVDAPFELVFRPQPEAGAADEEVELDESELDIVFYEGAAVDVGEAVAETLLLSLDPYPRAPGAEQALKAAGIKSEEEAGPFGALAGLRDRLKR